jgi:hypothetical protein
MSCPNSSLLQVTDSLTKTATVWCPNCLQTPLNCNKWPCWVQLPQQAHTQSCLTPVKPLSFTAGKHHHAIGCGCAAAVLPPPPKIHIPLKRFTARSDMQCHHECFQSSQCEACRSTTLHTTARTAVPAQIVSGRCQYSLQGKLTTDLRIGSTHSTSTPLMSQEMPRCSLWQISCQAQCSHKLPTLHSNTKQIHATLTINRQAQTSIAQTLRCRTV